MSHSFGSLSEAGPCVGVLLAGSACPILAASPSDQAKLVSADTGFAFGLLKELAKEQPARNVFISPYSISTVLQMVCNGAAGSTREEMARVLGTSGLEAAALNQAYKDLDTSVRSAQANVALNIANAIWYSAGIEVKPAFASLNKEFYGATMDALDFTDPRTGGIVNAWAEKNTSGRIKNIVAGPASRRYQDASRQRDLFQGELGAEVRRQGNQSARLPSDRGRPEASPDDAARAASSSIRRETAARRCGCHTRAGVWGCMSFCPSPAPSVDKLLASLNDQSWQDQLLRQMRSRKGSVVLPRFKLEYGAELKQPLQAMGMSLPFSRGADFSGMSASPLYLSAVKHKSFVEVNEEGTEAAAATVGIMSLAMARPVAPPFEMVVDRPFLFVIADNVTRAILFMGVVFEPASVSG